MPLPFPKNIESVFHAHPVKNPFSKAYTKHIAPQFIARAHEVDQAEPIPKNLFFVWTEFEHGHPFQDHYVENILAAKRLFPDYSVILYVTCLPDSPNRHLYDFLSKNGVQITPIPNVTTMPALEAIIHDLPATTLRDFLNEHVEYWDTFNPHYADPKNGIELLKDILSDYFSEKAIGLTVDMNRLLLLYFYGGIYLDCDIKILHPDFLFPTRLFPSVFAFIPQNEAGGDAMLNNDFIGSAPRNPLILEYILSILANFVALKSDPDFTKMIDKDISCTSGPLVLMSLVLEKISNGSKNMPDLYYFPPNVYDTLASNSHDATWAVESPPDSPQVPTESYPPAKRKKMVP